MNHLAHAVLSCDDADLLMGNMLTDMVNKKEADLIDQKFQKGISLHRAIDRFMDGHSITKKAKDILRPTQSKYAAVSIDLLWDYVLMKHWDRYMNESLSSFSTHIYEALKSNFGMIPEGLMLRFDKMISHQFLEIYQERESFAGVLERMNKRAKFNANFLAILDVYEAQTEEFDLLFNDFFPEVIQHVAEFCDC